MSGLMFIVSLLSVSFFQFSHPMVLAFLVICSGVVVMLVLGFVLSMFWLSYIILLTFLGGLLVLFVYVATLSPNEPIFGLKSFAWVLLCFFCWFLLIE